MRLAPVLIGAALVHAFPSVMALGQWSGLRAIPGGWCRWRGPAQPRVALTFDDGPDPKTTPLVLDRLDQLGLRGTFFCLGSRAELAPDLVMETVERGHEIALHGHVHEHHLAHTPRWVQRDLDVALEVVGDCGVLPRWYRPPFGQSSLGTVLAARRRGLELVHWSAWGREWDAADTNEVVDRVCASLEPGAIVLMHDSDDTSPPGTVGRVLESLGPIADELAHRELDATTVSELVA